MDKTTNYVGQPIFRQVLSLMDNGLISTACKQHKADKYAKKLSFKDHPTTMLYCIFSRCTSLREVQAGLELCNGKLNHLDLERVPARSTLSDGNKREPAKSSARYIKVCFKNTGILSRTALWRLP